MEVFGKTRSPGRCTSTTCIQYRLYRKFRCVLFSVKIIGTEVTENKTLPKISAITVCQCGHYYHNGNLMDKVNI